MKTRNLNDMSQKELSDLKSRFPTFSIDDVKRFQEAVAAGRREAVYSNPKLAGLPESWNKPHPNSLVSLASENTKRLIREKRMEAQRQIQEMDGWAREGFTSGAWSEDETAFPGWDDPDAIVEEMWMAEDGV